ncbi:MAG: DapH/DapD/GlmU-related protein [Gordonia sp. (in: high G+C Gram-positive bacteria)]|uniref:DapH/DapD/GlmU-related protein n=1 Tax=Gordonia sp. (in: high G+C Gram-positive bacteria) TaxID=84139 RepID=UPI0039E64042
MIPKTIRIGGPEFRAMHERVVEVTALTSRLNVLPFDDEDGKAELFAQILGRPLPDEVTIYPPFFTDDGRNIEFGGRVFVNQNCTFLDGAGITLGHRVMIGPKATFVTGGHPVDPADRKLYLTGAPIVLEENVWVGAGATILPGVTVGKDSVVAAGAVVADDVPPQTLVAGPKAGVVRGW